MGQCRNLVLVDALKGRYISDGMKFSPGCAAPDSRGPLYSVCFWP